MAGQVHACHSLCAQWLLGAEEDAQREAPGHLLHWSLLGCPFPPALVMSPGSWNQNGRREEKGGGGGLQSAVLLSSGISRVSLVEGTFHSD